MQSQRGRHRTHSQMTILQTVRTQQRLRQTRAKCRAVAGSAGRNGSMHVTRERRRFSGVQLESRRRGSCLRWLPHIVKVGCCIDGPTGFAAALRSLIQRCASTWACWECWSGGVESVAGRGLWAIATALSSCACVAYPVRLLFRSWMKVIVSRTVGPVTPVVCAHCLLPYTQ